MRIVAVSNHKGGSGKTTTAGNLGACLAEKGRRVLVVDLDAQGSASAWLGVQETEPGLLNVFVANGSLSDLVRKTDVEGLHAIGASVWLVGVEKALAREVGTERILRRKVEELGKDSWDYVLLDCPPSLGILTVNALAAAGEVLVPVEAHVMALAGLAQLQQTVDMVRDRLNPDLVIGGIVACRVDFRTRHAAEVVEELKERFGKLVYETVIRESVRLAECPSFGKPVTLYDPGGRGAEDYRQLAEEFMQQEGG